MSIPASVGQRYGAQVSVADSTALAALDSDGFTIGTPVWNIALQAVFRLTVSTAALSSLVVAVAGITGARWISDGGAAGFVTLAELASTTVTSGATLIGVNANGGMFSEPDLQHVLQEDVVLKAVLAATDGTGGASIVGVQDTGGFFAGTTVEAILADIGGNYAKTSAVALKLNIANPTFTGVMQTTSGGSAAAPAYGFAGTGGQYGMSFNGSNQVDISRAGVAVATFDFANLLIQGNAAALTLQGDTSINRDAGTGEMKLTNTVGVRAVSKFGLAAAPVAPQSVLASLTNNCTASGTTGTIPNFTSLTVYATDAQAIHDGISQLAKKLTVMETALKAFGLLIT